ncbi:MAG TPA: c-type cytochrome [Candidatus Sulfotelmatobacter sp.]|nr:c-type cytochrome [Candidatus Sulfotelmatobacter sp.]
MLARPIRVLLLAGTVLFAVYAFVNGRAQQTDAGPGAQQFMEYCAGCHGADGRGGDKAPSLVAPSKAARRSDSELFRVVHDGTKGGMPPFAQIGDANIAALLHYVRRLAGNAASNEAPQEQSVTGDVDAGRVLYFGKAQCSNCHLMQGKGGFIASNLTHYARGRAAEEILRAITDPDNPLVPSSQVVTLTTKIGQKITGVLRNEDAFTLAVQTEDGRFHLLARSDVTDVHYTQRSLMPRDYGKRLTSKELNDIVSFLVVESRSPRPSESGR